MLRHQSQGSNSRTFDGDDDTMKILTIVGARPQFIKAAAVSRALKAIAPDTASEIIVHTGQHFDSQMSDVFFEELSIPAPKYNLGISGGSHGAMTGRMLEAVERVLLTERPDWVIVYGDTNSTLAGTLAASKLHLPVAHVEAGLRSYNMRMPEEVNRIVADRLSTKLLCPTQTSVSNLAKEGITTGVHLVGDVMFDTALHFAKVAFERSTILRTHALQPKAYVLATCHRAENTDDKQRLTGIVRGLADIARSNTVVFPVHPRTRQQFERFDLAAHLEQIILIEPVSYLDMVELERNALTIITDSGGVQKEAFFYRVPCITTRDETEWIETVDSGWNVLVGSDTAAISDAFKTLPNRQKTEIQPYGSGNASQLIVDVLLS
jgi:UDP-GlcNAc3NAcA epimerase